MAVALVNTGLQFPDSTIQTTAGATNLGGRYIKLSSGLIIQWGTGTTTPGAPSTISFPLAFPSTCRGVQSMYTNYTQAQTFASAVTTITTSYFVIAVNLGNNQTMSYTWFAYGY